MSIVNAMLIFAGIAKISFPQANSVTTTWPKIVGEFSILKTYKTTFKETQIILLLYVTVGVIEDIDYKKYGLLFNQSQFGIYNMMFQFIVNLL